VRFTSAETGFSTRLVEKDYFATVLLHHVSGLSQELVFRGGTCLSKIHFGFYRLSEDLDFCVPIPVTSTRRQRSRSIAWLKEELEAIEGHSGVMKLQMPLTGANNSTQYTAIISYHSLLIRLIRQKLAVPGNDPVDLSDSRLSDLRVQLEAQLKPVLRTRDFNEFDLDRAVQTATAIVTRVS